MVITKIHEVVMSDEPFLLELLQHVGVDLGAIPVLLCDVLQKVVFGVENSLILFESIGVFDFALCSNGH